jgi:hypothetical protein
MSLLTFLALKLIFSLLRSKAGDKTFLWRRRIKRQRTNLYFSCYPLNRMRCNRTGFYSGLLSYYFMMEPVYTKSF